MIEHRKVLIVQAAGAAAMASVIGEAITNASEGGTINLDSIGFLDEASDLDPFMFMGLDLGGESFTGLLPREPMRAIEMRPERSPDPVDHSWYDPKAPKYKHGPKGGRDKRVAKGRARNKAARKQRRK